MSAEEDQRPPCDFCGHRRAGIELPKAMVRPVSICTPCQERLASWLLDASPEVRARVWRVAPTREASLEQAKALTHDPSRIEWDLSGTVSDLGMAFRDMLASNLDGQSREDQATTRNLMGMAYREMGLLHDALDEWALALRLGETPMTRMKTLQFLFDRRNLAQPSVEGLRALLFPS